MILRYSPAPRIVQKGFLNCICDALPPNNLIPLYTNRCVHSSPSTCGQANGFKTDRQKLAPKDGGPPSRLHPHVLLKRLGKLATDGKLDEALEMLQNAPADASNITTWNTMIHHCLKTLRYQHSYKIYVDMKRRGFRPSTATYGIMLEGLSRIEDFSKLSVQLSNAHSLYEAFLDHIKAVKKVDPGHAEISSRPVAFYIRILARAGEYNKMFDVLYSLDEDGPFAATEFHFSSVFFSIMARQRSLPGDKQPVPFRNASDAKLLWKHVKKVYERRPEVITSAVIASCLKALSKGRPMDQIFAFDIINEFLGLAKPGENPRPPKVPISQLSLDAILSLCIANHKYRLCIHYYEEVLKRDKMVVMGIHIAQVIQAYAHMTTVGSLSEAGEVITTLEWVHKEVAAGAARLQPPSYVYYWALMACWRSGDWASTTKILEFMSGCHPEDFLDSKFKKPWFLGKRSVEVVVPDIKCMACVVRAALLSDDLRNMRQCIRLFLHFNNSSETHYLAEQFNRTSEMERVKNNLDFYHATLVSSLKNMLTKVLESGFEDSQETKTWQDLLNTTKSVVRASPYRQYGLPPGEEQTLGGTDSLTAMDNFVEFDMAKRLSRPGPLR